jgi:hypothetical protein
MRLLWPLLTPRDVLPRWPFSHKARSPQVRTRSFTAQPPDLRLLSFGHKSFAVIGLLALLGVASLSGSCSSARGFAPCFLPTLGRPHAVALRFVRYGQLSGGLPPPRSRPCWAHQRKGPHAAGPNPPPRIYLLPATAPAEVGESEACSPAAEAPGKRDHRQPQHQQ